MKHYKAIHFGSRWHNGDIHFSRQFVRHIIDNFSADYYSYYLNKSTELLRDIDKLNVKPLLSLNVEFTDNLVHILGDDVYINTWIGCSGRKYLSLYDVDERLYDNRFQPLRDYNVSLGANYKMWSDAIEKLDLCPLSNNPIDYIPTASYDKFSIDNCRNFFNAIPNRRKVLICNNLVCSSQALNFDFDPILDSVTTLYPDMIFLVTNETKINKPNLYQTHQVINNQKESNLEEHGYISTFCDIVVGRGSGPFCFCITKDNCFNMNKRFIGMGYNPLIIFWYYNDKNMKFTTGYSVEEFLKIFKQCNQELGVIR